MNAYPTEQGVITPTNDNVIGAQMCVWEQPESLEMPSTRHRLPAMMERIWNPDAHKNYEDFDRRLAAAIEYSTCSYTGSASRPRA